MSAALPFRNGPPTLDRQYAAEGFPKVWTKVSVTERIRAELESIVNKAVLHHWNRVPKIELAIPMAARDLGISARRCKAWRYREAFSVSAAEAEIIRANWRSVCERRETLNKIRADYESECARLERLEIECRASRS